MSNEPRFRKSPCTQCGAPCYHLCYIRAERMDRLVCVNCFGKACDAASAEREKGDE